MAEGEVYCIYHSNDFDGICSAAIVYNHYLEVKDKEITLIPVDRGNEEKIIYKYMKDGKFSNAIVYMLDYSISIEDMWTINAMAKMFIWIDHHKSEIEKHEKFMRQNNYDGFLGIRNPNIAACELTYMWFSEYDLFVYPPERDTKTYQLVNNTLMNQIVFYLGRYDVWDHDENILNFQYGFRISESASDPKNLIWKTILSSKNKMKKEMFDNMVKSIIDNGKVIRAYDRATKKRNAIKWGKEVYFECPINDNEEDLFYKCYVLSSNYGGSDLFEGIPNRDSYDIFIRISWIVGEQYIISLYSTKHDVSLIAAYFGGGGHEKAAGFKTSSVICYNEDDSNDSFPVIEFKRDKK